MQPSLREQCVAEFLGTFLLVVLGVGCVAALKVGGIAYGVWDICMICGSAVTLGVYLSAGVSGGHVNPAVTIALAVFRKFPAGKVIPYVVAQISGAFVAAVVIYALYLNLFEAKNLETLSVFVTAPRAEISLLQAFMAELVGSAIFLVLIFALVDEHNGIPRGALTPLLIGLSVAVIGAIIGPLTGFAVNPARDFGPRVFAFVAGWGANAISGGQSIPYILIPLSAPVLGGLLGAWIYTSCIEAGLLRGRAVQALGNNPIFVGSEK